MRSLFSSTLLAGLLALPAHAADSLFVEAEALADRGGWSTDSQFILNMGSAYLIAHGMGTPVADATQKVTFPSTGTYHLHVRTKDWVAKWDAPGTPGEFEVLIDGKAVKTFGNEGADWHWQKGGAVEITKAETTISLKDLKGFNGRCDALFFTKDADFSPPNDDQTLFDFRRKQLNLPADPPTKDGYDLVVVGGGYSGLAAAISGARQGLKVALIHDRPVLGGNGSSEVHVWAMGGTQRGKYPRLGEIVDEFTDFSHDSPGLNEEFEDALKEKVARAEKNLDLYLNHFAFQVESKDNKIHSVTAVDTTTGGFTRFKGSFFCDGTGHGTIGALAGAKFMMLEKGHMGMSNMWSWKPANQAIAWPKTPWALPLNIGDFPSLHASRGPYKKFYKAEWFWEGGYDKHPIEDLEAIRDWNLRANFGAFTALKHGSKAAAHKKAKLMWMAFIGGNRESRRLEGDLILTGDDIVNRKEFPDASVPTTWSIDLHYPKKQYMKGEAKENPFISRAVHDSGVDRQNGYAIPYRIMYSKNIGNLFMAGRCVSVDRRALGTTRVMRTCGMMGEVVGKAAWIAATQETTPRGVYQNYLPILIDLMQQPGRAFRESKDGKLTIPPLPEGGLRVNPKEQKTMKLAGISVDDSKAKLTGKWAKSNNLKPNLDHGYQYASGEASAIFPLRVKESGTYEVRFYWQPYENRTKTAKIEVTHAGGKDTVTLDQTKAAKNKAFLILGTFSFTDVLPGAVTISNGTEGTLAIDAVQLIKK
ncbi:FAD-dependent oxidoreductase [Akkermansiaceae bacterium]|nr:FAD-dependent oxidoreductase [Akkermansiaceae bacterium]MDB4787793.1 FAD-dependent oxidoreductase [Akkermansiaceae bacterium]